MINPPLRQILFAVLVCVNALYAATIDRPLPVNNLNTAAGSNRSNVAFTEVDLATGLPGTAITGDSIRMPFASPLGAWMINTIQVWSAASILGDPLGNEFSNVALYGREAGGVLTPLASGTPNTAFDPVLTDVVRNSNPNIMHRSVTYSNGETYESTGGGTFYPLWEHTFSNLNFWLMPGAVFEFAVNGTGTSVDPNTLYGYWFNHFTNAARAGNFQRDADGRYLVFDLQNPTGPAFERDPLDAGLWDKRADMNVRIVFEAAPVPEPASLVLVGAGLSAAWLLRRYRRAA